jgi:hypothetical protein
VNKLRRYGKEDPTILTVENYKQFQYQNIHKFIEFCINYFNNQFDEPVIELNSIDICKLSHYYLNTSFLLEYTCRVNILQQNEIKTFFQVYIPEFLYNHCFLLNKCFYLPSLYILDKPITIKKESIKLDSLFNPISIFFKKNIVTIMQHNISLQYMINLFCSEQDYFDEALSLCLYNEIVEGNNLYEKFKLVFNKNFNSKEEIWKAFDKFFFDEYTQYVYYKCYGIQNFYELFNIAVKKFLDGRNKNEDNLNFIDLKNKRILFIELLLEPIFKYVSRLINNNKRRDLNYLNFTLDPNCILKNFRMKLHSTQLHSGSNLISGITSHQVLQVSPGINNPPSSIALLHETHFGRICPISISSEDPGKKVSVVYGTRIDEIGQFVF